MPTFQHSLAKAARPKAKFYNIFMADYGPNHQVFQDLRSCQASECHRVKKSEKINKPPSIVVKFESSLDHANFFSNLSKLPENKKIQVSQEFPVFLRRRLKQLKQIAWTERNKGFKTVIKRDSFGLRLYVKQGSAPWTKKVQFLESIYFSIMLWFLKTNLITKKLQIHRTIILKSIKKNNLSISNCRSNLFN